MQGVLPSVNDPPVKEQVEGILALAGALCRTERETAKFRARTWRLRRDGHDERLSSVEARRETQDSIETAGVANLEPSGESGVNEGSDDEGVQALARKKTLAKNLPKIAPSARAFKLQHSELRKEPRGDEELSIADAQVIVEKYRQRSRAAEAAVQASVERFHRHRKLQEPLLDDLKSLKKLVVGVRRSKREVKMVKQDAL
ncbi:Nipped-B-like protein B [Durusdinium trenchii]|uniref:Nipped-B-like protein B n=1 Tax=Durusdinium trenchii TaxID=1381693 RepID=A0ABP0SEZ0_9DINO